jgi:hypothetical protein
MPTSTSTIARLFQLALGFRLTAARALVILILALGAGAGADAWLTSRTTGMDMAPSFVRERAYASQTTALLIREVAGDALRLRTPAEFVDFFDARFLSGKAYLSLRSHGVPEKFIVNPATLLRVARQAGVPVVSGREFAMFTGVATGWPWRSRVWAFWTTPERSIAEDRVRRSFPPGFRPRPWPVSWGAFVVPLAAVGNACALGVVVLALSAAATILVRLPRAMSVAMRAVGACAHCGRPLETCPPEHARPPGALGAWPGFVRSMWREVGLPLVAAARWHPRRPYRLGEIALFALRVLVLGAIAAAITLAAFAMQWESADAICYSSSDTGQTPAQLHARAEGNVQRT